MNGKYFIIVVVAALLTVGAHAEAMNMPANMIMAGNHSNLFRRN
jgi:hypothetical protein